MPPVEILPQSFNFPFDFQDLPTPTYLVGGWVRDRLLQRQSRYLDLDFVLPQRAVETAQSIARKYKAGFVVLDAERQIARVVFENGTADFAQQMGDRLEDDLGRRDFCMNAIALECHQPMSEEHFRNGELSEQLFDPFHGIDDLLAKRIRMIAPENLAEDPLRILRGYRQAAQLGFEMEPWTKQVAIKLAPKLKQVAAERICTEISYLLSTQLGSQLLLAAIQDGILEDWLPPQELNLPRFTQIDQAIATLLARFPNLDLFFSKTLAGDRQATIIVKLVALTHNANMLTPLGISRTEQRWAMSILRYLPQFIHLLNGASPQAQYKLFQSTLEIFPAIATLALASGHNLEAISPWLAQWLNPHDPIAYPISLVTGDDLRQELGIAPSPKLGELLEMLRIAQVEGKITSKPEAIVLAKELFIKLE
ncbi:MAG: CCA tRNA nucleotidyltransferase [Pseudanabaenaceae cyanobacterium bins.39]|nr:CCA tRNA nucleotidyltransferase [Pseudanabaenaceae cyanobacterium bins.39]